MNFKDIYSPPYKTDDMGLYIKSANNVTSFTIAANNPKEEADNIVAVLNGTGGKKYKHLMLYGGHKIVTSNASVLITRGLGHLLGIEGMTLEEAYKTQDEFIEWTMKQLQE